MIKLRTLGECVIEIGGEAFTPESDAMFAALLFLCVERGKRVPRDHLAELIWPQTAPKRARHCLRQILYRLRMLGVELEGAREHVMLPDAAVEPTFSAAPAPDRLAAERRAGTLVLGPFLPGYRPPHSEPYAEWLDTTRAEIESRVRRSLLELVQLHQLRGEWAEVDALARECIRLDPLNEIANNAIATAAAMTGSKSEAIAIIDRYIHDLGTANPDLRVQATLLRRRIAERLPARRYSVPSDRCFVGRASLFETLGTALLRARNGESGAVMLTGAPGIGKTRLVQELMTHALMQGVRTVCVGCDEADADRPMSAWVDAVPRLRELPGALGIAPESLRFLRRLTEIDPTDAVLAEPLRDPRWIANRIRQAIVDLLDAVTAEGTVLLVIEDVHWLDGPSWAAITALLDWMTNRRFLLVLTTRGPHPAPNTPSRCTEQLVVCPVPALDSASAIALGHAIIEDHGGSLSDESLEWCVGVGEGNPLFLRELAVHCLEGGTTRQVPPSIQLLIDARIGRLPACARRVAEALAILGNFATLERLEAMLQLPAHELAGALVDLGRAMLLADDSATVRLRHELVRSRILAGVPLAAQRLLHRRAAIAIEPEVLTRSGLDLVWELISHARESGEESRSRTLVLHAASQHLLLGAPRDAAVLLERSLPLLSHSELYPAALRVLCRALCLDGQWRGAHLIAEELVRVSRGMSDRETTTRDLLTLFQTGVRSGQDPDWLGQLVLPIATDECENPTLRVHAARCGLTLSQIAGTTHGSDAFYNAIADLRSDSVPSSSQLDEVEMIYEANVGSLARAVRVANRLRRRIADAIDPFNQLSLFVALTDTYRMSDERKSALHVASDGLRVARQIGSDHFELALLGRILTIQLELGLLTDAQGCFHTAHALAIRHGSGILSEAIDVIGARIALAEGRTEDARALADRCLHCVATDAYPLLAHRRIIVTLAAEVALRTSSGAIDARLTDELLDVHERAQCLGLHDRSMAILVAALKRAGRGETADELLGRYLAAYRRAGAPWTENVDQLGLAGYDTGLRSDEDDS